MAGVPGTAASFPADDVAGPAAAAAMLARHLPASAAAAWLDVTRPALRLVRAAPGEVVVARLGGDPELPDDVPWPTWEGHGPLGYVGELRCAALAGTGAAVPASGRLLFFFFDGSYDDYEGIVSVRDPASAAGARVLHVPDGVPSRRRPAPDAGVPRLRDLPCTARVVTTFPSSELPEVEALLDATRPPEPAAADAFDDARWEWLPEPRHQVGGHPHAAQGPVEHDVAEAALRATPGAAPDRAAVEAEAARWSLLLQVDSDGALGAMWDDCGTLAWFTRDDDPTVHGFAWQSG